MPALTISVVDNTTDRLTVTAHGQVTGAGPAAVFVGSGGVIPAGLAPVTDYFLIVIDANTVKLATSSANALAGTAIDITTNGTLPLQLLIGLPYRRARTYVASAQVKSADLNALEDDDIALWNYLTGQAQSIFGDLTLAAGKNLVVGGTAGVTGLITATAGLAAAAGQHVTVSGTGRHKHGTMTQQLHPSLFQPVNPGALNYGNSGGVAGVQLTAAASAIAPVILPAGARILAVRIYMQDSATGPTTWVARLLSIGSTGTKATIASSSNSAGSGANQTLTIGSLTTVLAASTAYAISLENVVGAANGLLYMAEIDYDMP